MHKGKLCRLDTNDTKDSHPLRTDEVSGFYMDPPTVGDSFTFYSEPLNAEPGYVRVVKTSMVEEVFDGPRHLTFRTENSTYLLSPVSDDA
jgi:hypothetical protein